MERWFYIGCGYPKFVEKFSSDHREEDEEQQQEEQNDE